ncbi:MAG: VTT domain-containing protein [Cyclobacteriaceae bacterium]|nr:VTT domain-containing protein [Cyclobacteriaceae bacterium HetDA_MAG_MS6]
MSEEISHRPSDKTRFLIRNLIKGLIWLVILVGLYLYAKKHLDFSFEQWLGPVYEQPSVIYSIFLGSEVIFGIIPPELFMFWSLRNGDVLLYIQNILALSALSYVAGLIGYYIGSHFNRTQLYVAMKRNVFGKFEKHFNNYGGFLVVVAALTPIPFSGICMLVGAVNYSFRRFVWISMMRFVRFFAYAIIIWEANILN